MSTARLRSVLLGGFIAGALDITFAILFAVYRGSTPEQLLQIVASGLLGKAALSGGLPIAALGLGLHFFMAFLWAAAFVALAKLVPRITQPTLVSGIVFGIIVFFVMRLVVLPLSAFPYPVTFKPLAAGLDLLSHMFLFGLPIAWAAKRTSGRELD